MKKGLILLAALLVLPLLFGCSESIEDQLSDCQSNLYTANNHIDEANNTIEETNNNIDKANSIIEDLNNQILNAQNYDDGTYDDLSNAVHSMTKGDTVSKVGDIVSKVQ